MARNIVTAALACALLALPAAAQEGSLERPNGGKVELGSLDRGEWCVTPVVNAALAQVLAGQRARLDRDLSGAYLGVSVQSVTEARAKELKLGGTRGAIVTSVVPDSPAERAGLRVDDVVVSVNGKEVASGDDLTELIRGHAEGQQVTLEVMRDGRRERLTATLAKRPEWSWPGVWRVDPDQFNFELDKLPEHFRHFELPEGLSGEGLFVFGGRARLGVTLLPLTDQLREHFGVEAGKGALVSGVSKNSPAERAGLRAGDVLLSVDGQEVRRTGDVATALRKGGEGSRTVQLEVIRDRSRQTLSATIEEERPANEE